MHIPKVGFNWDFSIGNLVTLIALVAGGFGAWYTLKDQAADAAEMVAKLPGLELRVAALETSHALMAQTIETSRASSLTFQASVAETFKSIEADRRAQADVNAQVLTQLAVIVSRLDDMQTATTIYRGPFTTGVVAGLAESSTVR